MVRLELIRVVDAESTIQVHGEAACLVLLGIEVPTVQYICRPAENQHVPYAKNGRVSPSTS